jgi:UDP-GlcNAc:undecaprenyl-phosphate/decaprenyl-phosphate GlcNAc-1-phosphate transferase
MSGIYNRSGIWWRHFIPMLVLTALLAVPAVQDIFKESGWRWAYILAFSFSMSFCLTPVFRNISWSLGILDMPNDRKNHQDATPMMGGAAVYIAFLTAILINNIYSPELGAILIGASVLFCIGIIDDIRGVKASARMAAQIGCALLVMSQGVILSVLPSSMGIIGVGLNAGLTLLWVVGITNALNFFDGMDGMAAGLGVVIGFFLCVVAMLTDHHFIGWISVAMVGACIGFMPYNLMKNARATIFLGDSGSTVIGFVLACIAVYGDWAEGRPIVAIVSPILIFWVLIFDMVHITVERIMTGKVKTIKQWIEYVGKDHLHHRLAFVFNGQKRSVFFIYLLSIHLGTSAIVLRNATDVDALLVLLQAAIIVIMITFLEKRGRTIADTRNGIEIPGGN